MPNYSETIENFILGDDLDIKRKISDIPTSATVTKAWFTVKESYDEDDIDAIIQKIITPTIGADGQITNPGTNPTSQEAAAGQTRYANVTFSLAAADTILMEYKVKYVYDIQILTSTGKLFTAELGKITGLAGVTQAIS